MSFFKREPKDNNWIVVTGAPSAGKTTILETLSQKSYNVLPENARIYIDQQIAGGRTIGEIRADEFEFQKVIAHMNIEREKTLSRSELVFMERAIPDSLAYFERLGRDVPDFLQEAAKYVSYRKVFLLEPLPFESDYARTEKSEDVAALHVALEKAYRGVGADPVLVPATSVEGRITFILNSLD
jgi:predicted ATPase